LIRVFLDSNRARFEQLLAGEPDLQMTEDAESADVLITADAEERPDDVPVIVVLSEADHAQITRTLRAGARGAVPSSVTGPGLAAAVRAVYHGWVVSPPDSVPAAPVETLTPREVEVLRMLADGHSNKEIAGRLGISEHTVKFHVNSILGKLGAGSRTEAVTIGLRSGLILL
jgi:two-component system, NarL family, response regulator YdfI